MTYDREELMKRIKKLKCAFWLRIMLSAIFTIAFVIFIPAFSDVTVTFISVVGIILCLIISIRSLLKFKPFVLYSSEIVGTNVKEHEYATSDRRYAFAYRVVRAPRVHTSAASDTRKRTKPPTSATVYLKTDNGDIIYIDRLTNAQTDIYEIGDTLYKFPGTRYPVIVGRAVSAQPCPLCGTANRSIEKECITCALPIVEDNLTN